MDVWNLVNGLAVGVIVLAAELVRAEKIPINVALVMTAVGIFLAAVGWHYDQVSLWQFTQGA